MSVESPPTRPHEIDPQHISPPKIAYEQALHSRFVLAGQRYQVSTCPMSILRELVRSALPDPSQGKVRNRLKREELLELLALLEAESDDDMTRWYTIETLLVLGVSIQFVKQEA
jgi:hypothetical protein